MKQTNLAHDGFINKAKGFDGPISLPADPGQAADWQAANKAWWEATPMRYDWREQIPYEPGTKDYFQEVDSRFFAAVRKYLPWTRQPFEQLIPFASLQDKDVLEIGVGQGSHAHLIAPRAKSFTGIDLTLAASGMTRQRFAAFQLPGRILEMDAERMDFPDNSFDFIWSWGVIHHSANTLQILREMHRVLRPGGTATVMVYHRSFWRYYVVDAILNGVLRGKLRTQGSLQAISQAGTDGAIARFYRPAEWSKLCAGLFDIQSIEIYGQKADVLPIPAGRFKDWLDMHLPNTFTAFLTNRLRLGTFLVARMSRI